VDGTIILSGTRAQMAQKLLESVSDGVSVLGSENARSFHSGIHD